MKAPKAVLFDLDGTLLDTARDLGNALNHVLESHQLPLCSYQAYRPVASHGSTGLLKLGLGERFNEYDIDALRKEFLDHYDRNICQDTCLFEGVEELIHTINERALPWGIVTNKPGWLTDALLPNFAALKSCQVVVSGDSLNQRKPHPAPLIFASESLQVNAADVWYVGDAERDIQAANAASMVSIIANYGYICQSDLPDTWQADYTVDNVPELTRLLNTAQN